MKRLLLILILTLSFQTLVKADDIRDFEIEGMSVGDSLLDFLTKNEINNNKSYLYNNKKYAVTYKESINESYDGIQIEFKNNDNKFLIKSISGKVLYKDNDINNCYEKEKNIVKTLKNLFKNKSEYIDHGITPHPADTSGKSKGTWHTFDLDDNTGHISVECMDWTEEMNYIDNLKVSIISTEMNKYLLNEAYN